MSGKKMIDKVFPTKGAKKAAGGLAGAALGGRTGAMIGGNVGKFLGPQAIPACALAGALLGAGIGFFID